MIWGSNRYKSHINILNVQTQNRVIFTEYWIGNFWWNVDCIAEISQYGLKNSIFIIWNILKWEKHKYYLLTLLTTCLPYSSQVEVLSSYFAQWIHVNTFPQPVIVRFQSYSLQLISSISYHLPFYNIRIYHFVIFNMEWNRILHFIYQFPFLFW